MKSKHLILCLIGFIVIVHAHYFNSWINFYEAPISNHPIDEDLSQRSTVEPVHTYEKPLKINLTANDSIAVYQIDTAAMNGDEFVSNDPNYYE